MGKWPTRVFRAGFGNLFLIGTILTPSLTAKAVEIQKIHSFASISTPDSVLVQDASGAFYGTTSQGGDFGFGTIFRATANGIVQILASFDGTNGSYPNSPMVLGSDGAIYGTTRHGGSNDGGTVFRMTTNGDLTTLASFDDFTTGDSPQFGLIKGSDGAFYGTTTDGGPSIGHDGTVFRVTTNGALTVVASFGNLHGTNQSYYAQMKTLALGTDGFIYGATTLVNSNNAVKIFRVNTNGTLSTLASFIDTNNQTSEISLIAGSNGMFYGTTMGYFYQPGTSPWSISSRLFQVGTNGNLTIVAEYTNGLAFNPGLAQTEDGILYGTTPRYASGTNYLGGAIMRWDTSNKSPTLIPITNQDANSPRAGLMLGQDGALYGTMAGGGDYNYGAVVRVATNGESTVVSSFQYTNAVAPREDGLVGADDGMMYGTSELGGSSNCGTLFCVSRNGTFKTLVTFDGENGNHPLGTLIEGNDGALYGTTASGGAYNDGTLFKFMTNGILTTLVSFDYTNTGQPETGLTRGKDGLFYGMARTGSPGDHAVFRVSTNGAFKISAPFPATNSPLRFSALSLGIDGAFYGTTFAGGIYNTGTVFRVTTNGEFSTLLSFDGSNGAKPEAALTLGNDGAFYGTTLEGGISNRGTIFRMTTNGTLTSLVSLNNKQGVSNPFSGLTPDGHGAFYGAAGELFRVTTNGVLTFLKPNFYVSGYENLVSSSDGWFYGITDSGQWNGSIYRMNPSVRMLPLTRASSAWDVHLNGIPGDSYQVLRATNLLGPWETLTSLTTDSNGDGQYKDMNSPSNNAFYQVKKL